MSKIDKLGLCNFKFFKEEEVISLEGKNLLLYGENGSGKSSLFWGLYTLLEASLKTKQETDLYFRSIKDSDESLVNIYAKEIIDANSQKKHYNSYIKVKDDNGMQYTLSLLTNNIYNNSNVMESRKATDFINYQAIFKFQEFRNSEYPNLYDVFCYSILPYVSFSSFTLRGKLLSNANDMWNAYKEGPGTTTNIHGDRIQAYKNSPAYKNFISFEKHFNTQFEKMIDFINTNSKDIIKELGYDIKFQLEYIKPTFIKKDKSFKWHPFKIGFIITEYNGKSINITKPQTFLNEAKMAAIATTIRFSILNYRINSVVQNALKVLVLDDLMISLDMSNRDKLLDLLLNDYSNKYQILFLTHDKGLYNFVDYKIKQHKQNEQWLRKGMYIDEDEHTKQEFPVIVDGECTPLEKAHKYYKAKDYTTTAVYIRQTLEKMFSEIIPDEIKRRLEKNMKDKFISLEQMWQRVCSLYNIPKPTQELFDQSKLMIFNPSAHNQRLSQPIYREELKRAFKLIDELRGLKLKIDTILIEKGKTIIFKHPSVDYTFEFELKSDMIESKGVRSDPKCKIHTWQYKGVEFYDFNTHGVNKEYSTCSPKFSKLKLSLYELPLNPAVNEDCFLDNTTIEVGLLREALKRTDHVTDN